MSDKEVNVSVAEFSCLTPVSMNKSFSSRIQLPIKLMIETI